MSSKRSSINPSSGSPTSVTEGKLVMLNFRREAERSPSNITTVTERWDEALRSEYGPAGGFIKTGEYYQREKPPRPDLSDAADEIEEEAMKSAYKASYKSWALKVEADVEVRTNIYADMWAACSEEARNEVEKDPSFKKLSDASTDPLSLWTLLVRHCSVVNKKNDPIDAELAAEKERLLGAGFADWTRLLFQNFTRSSARHGRKAYAAIAQEIGRSEEEVRRYKV